MSLQSLSLLSVTCKYFAATTANVGSSQNKIWMQIDFNYIQGLQFTTPETTFHTNFQTKKAKKRQSQTNMVTACISKRRDTESLLKKTCKLWLNNVIPHTLPVILWRLSLRNPCSDTKERIFAVTAWKNKKLRPLNSRWRKSQSEWRHVFGNSFTFSLFGTSRHFREGCWEISVVVVLFVVFIYLWLNKVLSVTQNSLSFFYGLSLCW